MTDEELRAWAQSIADRHTPANQVGNNYQRCALCSYVRHPCDTYEMAAWVITLLDRMESP